VVWGRRSFPWRPSLEQGLKEKSPSIPSNLESARDLVVPYSPLIIVPIRKIIHPKGSRVDGAKRCAAPHPHH
jgi:hypothetical protein